MKKFKKALFFAAIIILCLAGIVLAVLLGLFVYARCNIDFEGDTRLFDASGSFESTLFFADSDPTDEEYTPAELEISGGLKKLYCSLDEVSPYLKWGFIAVEDRRFYEHSGVDIKRTAYAALNYLFRGERRFGGSTVTQQVVKNISGDSLPTLGRKLNEIIRAVHIEKNYTKDEILGVYLNVIPMGENMYGVAIASRRYFGKEPGELTPKMAATLIGITNAPTAYNPYQNPEKCLEKRNSVLKIMAREGVITEEECARALSEPLGVLPKEEGVDIYDSWFVETVIDEASALLSKKLSVSRSAAERILLGGGYKIYTTVDISVQNALESYFENKNNFPPEIESGLGYAMVVTKNESGDLAAIVGGVGKKTENRILNRATVNHTPGSAIKPIALYAPLIDEGKINWATVIDDVPSSFSEKGEPYPKNSPNIYGGLTTVKEGLVLSKNTLAVSLAELRGVKEVYRTLKEDYGITSLVEREKTKDGRTLTDLAIAPMALGQLTYGMPLSKLTEAYSVFAGEGVHKKMRSFLEIRDSDGGVVLKNESEERRLMRDTTARIVTKMLEEAVRVGTAKQISLKNHIPTAGKTGTSSASRDKLFVGFTPYYTAGIWCGYDRGAGSAEGLSVSHLEIWDEVMTEIHNEIIGQGNIRSFSDEGLIRRPYCKDSGRLYTEGCLFDPRGTRLEYGYFTPDNAPNEVCKTHVTLYYDSVEKGIALEGCPEENLVKISLLDIPDRAFIKEVNITDAEFVFRKAEQGNICKSEYLPFFYNALPPEEFAGVSGNKKQFNSACKKH